MLRRQRSHSNEKKLSPATREEPLTATTREVPTQHRRPKAEEGRKKGKKRPKIPTASQITDHLRGAQAGQNRTGQNNNRTGQDKQHNKMRSDTLPAEGGRKPAI